MADIELLIKIPEGLKKDFEFEQWTALSCMEMKNALINGTPLTKGHGNLYDERDLKKLGNVYFQEVITKDSNLEFHFPELIIKATPIIEADKGE